MKKISIIIPVYNGEKYLGRCIDSVLDQTDFNVQDLELVLINDGSKDGSLKIMEGYKTKFPSIITVIDQQNMGVAKTRNKGIAMALGEYCVFVDQDDYIDRDFCKIMYDAITQSDSDVVAGGYRRPDTSGSIKYVSTPKQAPYWKYINVAAWAKIHRTEFLKQRGVYFFDNAVGEDSVFTVKEISETRKWHIITYVGYNWFYNDGSVSNTTQKKLDSKNRDSLARLLNALVDIGDTSAYFNYYILRTTIFYLLFSGKNSSAAAFMATHDKLFTTVKSRSPAALTNKYMFFGPRGEALKVRIIIACYMLCTKLGLVRLFAGVYCNG